MQNWRLILAMGLVLLTVLGCNADDNGPMNIEAKPSVDPDVEWLSGKSDALSNRYTHVMDTMNLGDLVEGEIDWPDWFHGYPVELKAGQTVSFQVNAIDHGIVRLYGPALGTGYNDRPYFGRAAVRTVTEEDRYGVHTSKFTVQVNESGTYMLVFGPRYVWNSVYDVKTECVAGCKVETTVEALEANPEKFDGMIVTVEGWINLGYVACTRMACSELNPCCNRCGGALNLHSTQAERADGIALTEEGDRYACEGDECNERQICSVEEGRYRIEGIFTVGEFENAIEVLHREELVETCQTDADCAIGWCRAADADMTGRECVPFVGEGDSCGGFTRPNMVESCGPDLTCLYRPFIADAPGTCRNVVTMAELEANPERWDGVRIAIDGEVTTGYAICTQMACTLENPCCNSCGAGQTLSDATSTTSTGLDLIQDGQTLGCGGNNCMYASNCDLEDGRHRVVGIFRAGQFGHDIETESILAF